MVQNAILKNVYLLLPCIESVYDDSAIALWQNLIVCIVSYWCNVADLSRFVVTNNKNVEMSQVVFPKTQKQTKTTTCISSFHCQSPWICGQKEVDLFSAATYEWCRIILQSDARTPQNVMFVSFMFIPYKVKHWMKQLWGWLGSIR